MKRLSVILPLLLSAAGAGGGWLYYHFVGCPGGSCPIASSPVLMPLYGAVLGFLAAMIILPGKKKKEPEEK